MIVLGIDPGLAHLGYALIEMPQRNPLVLGCIKTVTNAKKRRLLVVDELLQRLQELEHALRLRIWKHVVTGQGPHCCLTTTPAGNPRLVAIEAFSPPRGAGSAARLGMSYGVVITLAGEHGLPIVQETPQELKRILTGRPSASKAKVEEVVRGALALKDFELKAPKEYHEHMWDAAGAVLALWELGQGSVLRLVA